MAVIGSSELCRAALQSIEVNKHCVRHVAALALTNVRHYRDLFCSWYHGNISRDDVEKMMNPPEDGLFLVRESANYPGDYTLCVAFEGKVEHYHISSKDNQLTVDDETYFNSMVKLIEVRNTFLL